MLMIHRISRCARRVNTQRCGEGVADEHAADPADNSEPERDVVTVARAKNLPSRPMMMPAMIKTICPQRRLSPGWGRSVPRHCRSTRSAEGAIQPGDHRTTGFADSCAGSAVPSGRGRPRAFPVPATKDREGRSSAVLGCLRWVWLRLRLSRATHARCGRPPSHGLDPGPGSAPSARRPSPDRAG